jgi:hypothetical protein
MNCLAILLRPIKIENRRMSMHVLNFNLFVVCCFFFTCVFVCVGGGGGVCVVLVVFVLVLQLVAG